MWISFLCHCVFQYSSLRSRWLLRSECSAALMGWFGIQLDAGSYFGMPDKVFWWRTIAAVSGDSLMVYGWEHTPCLWLHKTMHYVLLFPYHTISHSKTHRAGQRQTTSGSTTLNSTVTVAQGCSQTKFYFYILRDKTNQNIFFRNEQIEVYFFFVFVCSSGNTAALSVYSWKRTTFRL